MENWKIRVQLLDDKGNVKMNETFDAPMEKKTICLALSSKDEEGKQKQVRPSCLEFKAKELIEAFQDEEKTIPCRLNGEASGFFVDTTIRFANYQTYLASLNAPKKEKVIKEENIEM